MPIKLPASAKFDCLLKFYKFAIQHLIQPTTVRPSYRTYEDDIIIRKSQPDDIDKIMAILESAKQFMRTVNNKTQWSNGYPDRKTISDDIEKGNSFTGVNNNGELIFTFAFIKGEDPTYKVIKNGNWLNDEPYGTIHRIASNGKTRGVLQRACEFCFKYVDNIRIDTHKDNSPMLKALKDSKFQKCGEIICRDGTPRIAFQKIKPGLAESSVKEIQ